MKVLVAYESRGGTTRRTAEAIASESRRSGNEVTVAPISDLSPERLQEADAVFVGSWVQGFLFVGVGPAHAVRKWIAALPSQSGKPVAVFCTYALNPRGTLAAMENGLRARGANVLGGRAFHRRRPAARADEFAREVLDAARSAGAGPTV